MAHHPLRLRSSLRPSAGLLGLWEGIAIELPPCRYRYRSTHCPPSRMHGLAICPRSASSPPGCPLLNEVATTQTNIISIIASPPASLSQQTHADKTRDPALARLIRQLGLMRKSQKLHVCMRDCHAVPCIDAWMPSESRCQYPLAPWQTTNLSTSIN